MLGEASSLKLNLISRHIAKGKDNHSPDQIAQSEDSCECDAMDCNRFKFISPKAKIALPLQRKDEGGFADLSSLTPPAWQLRLRSFSRSHAWQAFSHASRGKKKNNISHFGTIFFLHKKPNIIFNMHQIARFTALKC